MSKKWMPDGDSEFADMARLVARQIADRPERYRIPAEDVRAIEQAVARFRAALAKTHNRLHRSKATTMEKNRLRKEAEDLIRRAGHLLRINRDLTPEDKVRVGIKERPTRLKVRACPQVAPRLMFVSTVHGSLDHGGTHVIKFFNDWGKQSQAKPEGAVRLELYVEPVPPGEPMPKFPGQRHGGRHWYLGSFTRSPMTVKYPPTDEPARMVYYARWAGATCDVGPFSQPLMAPVEGTNWSQYALPSPEEGECAGQTVIVTTARRELPRPKREEIEEAA